ncbi:OmpH family outer membrane protein [Halonatronum saccharophilum]|uniref:OmpH family outer membrane protein n=1 Tax=Halonatronum saccharophilum TaxID=150060 RepID=UPI000488418D|nr:OmpH family outer membrane protein [Halonatronum saccharophilum]
MKKLVLISSLILIMAVFVVGCTQEAEVEVRTEVEDIKVAVVDQDRIWTESDRAKEYQEELNKKIREVQSRYEEEVEGLNEGDTILKHQEAYGEINELREELRVQFSQEVADAVSSISQGEGFDIVLDKEDVRYGGIDITDMVIESLN